MKRIISVLILLIVISTCFIIYKFQEEINITIKDWINIRPKQYFGTTVDMSQLISDSENYIVNNNGEDLIDIASGLGMNTLRITNITSTKKDSITSSYSHEQWEKVLNKMRKKGMFAVVLVEANAPDTKFNRLVLDDYYIKFVENYIVTPDVCNFSNILAIDIANEPLLNANNISRLRESAHLIKSTCPNAKLTIGSWRTYSGKKDKDGKPEYNWHDPKEVLKTNGFLDIHSVHIYGFDKEKDGKYPDPYALTVGYLKEIKKYTNKPIFIEEFGAGNGDSITDQKTLGSPELQKNAYEGVLKATYDFKNRGVLGATSYIFHPRNDKPESWNILKNKGNTILPAAYTFKKYL